MEQGFPSAAPTVADLAPSNTTAVVASGMTKEKKMNRSTVQLDKGHQLQLFESEKETEVRLLWLECIEAELHAIDCLKELAGAGDFFAWSKLYPEALKREQFLKMLLRMHRRRYGS